MNQKTKKTEEPKEGLTKTEKRILIGEGTFLSVGFVVTLILAVMYTVNIDGKANANARANAQIIVAQRHFEVQYLKQVEILNKTLMEMNTRLSKIEGKLGSLKR